MKEQIILLLQQLAFSSQPKLFHRKGREERKG